MKYNQDVQVILLTKTSYEIQYKYRWSRGKSRDNEVRSMFCTTVWTTSSYMEATLAKLKVSTNIHFSFLCYNKNMSSSLNLTKIEKLMNQKYFKQCRLRIKVVIYRDGPLLLCFQDAPNEVDNGFNEWVTANTKGMSTIILCLGDAVLTKTRELFDGDGTANALWERLVDIYTMLPTQAIANLHTKMEALIFKYGEDWDKQLSLFMSIIDALAS